MLSEKAIKVTVWGENIHERRDPQVAAIYPRGMHTTIAEAISERLGLLSDVRTTTLDSPDSGLSHELLQNTDVLVWWGHLAHDAVPDHLVDEVVERIWRGMGLVMLHSGHLSKIFRKLMGTSCNLRWRSSGDRETVWTVDPSHPIAKEVPEVFVIEAQEMYGEHFDIPAPEELVFISSFLGGEVFRSGCCFRRGRGRIFYFSPGDQEYPVYHHPEVRKVIANAVAWAHPEGGVRPEPYRTEHKESGWYVEGRP